MELFLTRTFQKNFRKLPGNIRARVKDVLNDIYLDPQAGKKLSGELEGEYSLRIGAYRIIYFIDKERNVWLETVRHRKDVYQKK